MITNKIDPMDASTLIPLPGVDDMPGEGGSVPDPLMGESLMAKLCSTTSKPSVVPPDAIRERPKLIQQPKLLEDAVETPYYSSKPSVVRGNPNYQAVISVELEGVLTSYGEQNVLHIREAIEALVRDLLTKNTEVLNPKSSLFESVEVDVGVIRR